ncbi:hypothetical protein [Pseudomonas soli]|uniref:Uncharacterized protein n=1 Tax=Pseudomonas soli TaxID=1306993 RepID=A0AAJ5MHV6_9PSED|nr:hypothetical protein [Pseudomonas soli]MDW9404024.1 hypothetical protein [Pseudomonas soli]PYC41749.1 hypothetical protein DMX05_14440 [Pseudomonas soli]UXZ43970.1 hypothetical protein K7K07_18065 [Pseudomonas soli]
MDLSLLQSLKLEIISATGLSRDALHIYVGLALLVSASCLTRRSLGSLSSWMVVLAGACLIELFDLMDDKASLGYWRWHASLHDIANTLFWPTIFVVIYRFRLMKA